MKTIKQWFRRNFLTAFLIVFLQPFLCPFLSSFLSSFYVPKHLAVKILYNQTFAPSKYFACLTI